MLNHSAHIKTFMQDFVFKSLSSSSFSQKELLSGVYEELIVKIQKELRESGEEALLAYFNASIVEDNKATWLSNAFNSNFSPSVIINESQFEINLNLRILKSNIPDTIKNTECMCVSNHSLPAASSSSLASSSRSSGSSSASNPASNVLHCLSCERISNLTIRRHDNIADAIVKVIHKFIPGASADREFLIHKDIHSKKCDIKIVLPNKDVYYVDVSVFNPALPSYFKTNPVLLMKSREREKCRQYNNVGLGDSPNLIPFIMDVTGNLGKRALEFIDILFATVKHEHPYFRHKFITNIKDTHAAGMADSVNEYLSKMYRMISPPIAKGLFDQFDRNHGRGHNLQ